MTVSVFSLVLLAAALHAIWNAVIKGTGDKTIAIGLVALGHTKVTCKILDGTRHESLNELKREEAFKLYLNWVNLALD